MHAAAAPQQAATGAASWKWPDPVESMARIWELGMAQWLAPAVREALVRRRWDRLFEFARAHSPFYRDLYAVLPPGPQADPRTVPVVTKAMLMADLDRALTDARLRGPGLREFIADSARVGAPFAGDCAVWTSSGTSGTPGVFVHDAGALAVYDAIQFCRFHGLSGGPDGGLPPVGPARYALVAATGGHFAGVGMIERLRSLFPAMRDGWRCFSLMQPVDALVAQLNAFGPDTLATYPSAALLLAQEQRAGRLRIAPRRIWTGGECLTASARRELVAAFGASVREEYGASEFPSLANSCSAGFLHVNGDWALLEPVDRQYRPVAPGSTSHTVLLTNLANRALPLIRYDLGDSITVLPGGCSCANPLPRIRVQGRDDDCLDLAATDGHDVRLLPLVLTTVFEEEAQASAFQLEQRGPAALRLWVQPDRAGPALAALRRHLSGQGLAAVTVDLSATPLWCNGAGGKVRRIVRAANAAKDN